jgi:hypothetical protein
MLRSMQTIRRFEERALLRGGMFPQASVYPALLRATRDLLRRRCHLARKHAELFGETKSPIVLRIPIPPPHSASVCPLDNGGLSDG